ncbi:MAG TPA: type II and III secretion system protein family protein, partial [Vicinamibacterales bacterium]|nr:type II and III secretion system protein family protein [Vicinamibacterales bacterium]
RGLAAQEPEAAGPEASAGAVVTAGTPVNGVPDSEAPDGRPHRVSLVVGRSAVLDVGTPIARVSLTDPAIADALATSSSQLLLNGKAPGTISMFVWQRAGGVRRYEVVVQRDLDRLREQMKALFPGEAIDVRSNGADIVLAGTVSSKDVADKAISIAAGHVARREDVVSVMSVQQPRASNQVLLRVRFAEVSRSALTELGASFFTSPTGVRNTVGRITTQQFSAPGFSDIEYTKSSSEFGAPVTSAGGKFTFGDFLNLFILSERYDLGVVIRALQERGLFQTLAEPNLVAESGKEASFLAGGEFPIPVAQGVGTNLAISVVFKEFGIRLNFTPTVNGDRVHLKVRPEVSTLDFANAVVLQGFRIPALTTRRTETELELRDGQTFAIAGLINNSLATTLQKVPGIGDIPIIGHLFRSRAAQKDQTELVVMITPQILPLDSPGVTPALPRLQEQFLPPVPPNRLLDPPPPAFGGPAAAPGVAAAGASGPRGNPESRTESGFVTSGGSGSVDPPLQNSDPTRETGANRETRPSAADRKALEAARRQEEAARKAAARQAEEARKRAEAEEKRLRKLAEEQARRDAEAARRAQKEAEKAAREAARQAAKQAEAERRHQQAIAEAEARLQAAKAAYERERQSREDNQAAR